MQNAGSQYINVERLCATSTTSTQVHIVMTIYCYYIFILYGKRKCVSYFLSFLTFIGLNYMLIVASNNFN